MIIPGAAYKAELGNPEGKSCYLIACDFTTGIRRFALWRHDVVYHGDTYFGLVPISLIDAPIQDSDDLVPERILKFEVQNDPSLLAALIQGSRRQFCDGYHVQLVNGAPVNDEARHIWHCRMVAREIAADGNLFTATLGLEEIFWENQNRSPRLYSNTDQHRLRDATDDCFAEVGGTFNIKANYVQKSGLQK